MSSVEWKRKTCVFKCDSCSVVGAAVTNRRTGQVTLDDRQTSVRGCSRQGAQAVSDFCRLPVCNVCGSEQEGARKQRTFNRRQR